MKIDRFRRLLPLIWLALLFCLAAPAGAFQVKVIAPYVMLKPQPDQHSGPDIERLGPQWAQLLETRLAGDGELWCRVQVLSRRNGWVPARYIDPALLNNQPLRIADLPAALVFDFAQRQVTYNTVLNDSALKAHLRRWTLMMEMAMLKESWDTARQRLNFLDISRRIGIKISLAEYQVIQQQLRVLEQKYQQILVQWQHA